MGDAISPDVNAGIGAVLRGVSRQPIMRLDIIPGVPRGELRAFEALQAAVGEPAIAWLIDDSSQRFIMNVYNRMPRETVRAPMEWELYGANLPSPESGTGFLAKRILEPVRHNGPGGSVTPEPYLAFTPYTAGPQQIRRLAAAREMFRKEWVPGSRYNAMDLQGMKIDQMMVAFDGQGHAYGSIPFVFEDLMRDHAPRLRSHTEALRLMQAPLLTERSDAQLAFLYERADTVFGPETEYAKRTGRTQTIERQLSVEHAFGIMERLDRFKDDPATTDLIYELAAYEYPNGEIAVQLCDSPQEFADMKALFVEDPAYARSLMSAFMTIEMDASNPDARRVLPYEKPLNRTVYRLGRALVKSAVSLRHDTSVPPGFITGSFGAIKETLDELYGLDRLPLVPPEQSWHSQLSEYAVKHAADMQRLSVIAPIVERYFRLKLDRINPGEFAEARAKFYGALNEQLYTHSNESTGDDRLQLQLLTDVFTELARIGYWKEGGTILDAGSGNGERILGPLLDTGIMRRMKPGTVYAVDADTFPAPAHGKWIPVQRMFEDPTFPRIHAQQQGKEGIEPVDGIVCMWSPINDVDAENQQKAINNFARSLRKRDGDTPGGFLIMEVPIGYIQQMIDLANRTGRREMGQAHLDYPGDNGVVVQKPLEILKKHDLVFRPLGAGLRPLNLPPGEGDVRVNPFFVTAQGKDRAIIVYERVGDPIDMLDTASDRERGTVTHWYGSSSGHGRERHRHRSRRRTT